MDEYEEYLEIVRPLLDGRYNKLRRELGEPQTEEDEELLAMIYESETQVMEKQFEYLGKRKLGKVDNQNG